MSTWPFTYAPGRSVGFARGRLAVLVDLPTDDELVARLAAVVSTGHADTDAVLDVLVSKGLRTVASFAVAESSAAGVRVVVRGEARVDGPGGEELRHESGLWSEDSWADVASAGLTLGEADARSLPLQGGIVLASRLVLEGPDAGVPAPPPAVEPEPEDEPVSDQPETILPSDLEEELEQIAEEVEAGVPDGDADGDPELQTTGHTVALAVDELPRPSGLRLPDGSLVELDRPVVLGRRPSIPDGWVGPRPELVELSDPARDVSAQHLLVVPTGEGLVVRDLGSTNGTDVVEGGGVPVRLRAHADQAVAGGVRLLLAGVYAIDHEVAR